MSKDNQPNGLGNANSLTSNPEEKEHPLRNAFIWGQVGRILEITANIAFSVLIIRLLSPSDYGLYAIIWSIVNTTFLLLSLGMEEVVARYSQSILHYQNSLLKKFQRRLVLERLILGIIAGITLFLLAPHLGSWMKTSQLHEARVILALLIVLISGWNLFSAIKIANLKMREYTIIRIANQVLNLLLAAVGFYFIGIEVEVALWGMIIGLTVGNLAFFISFLVHQKENQPEQNSMGVEPDSDKIRKFGFSLWLTNLATYGLATQIDILLIAGLLGDQAMVSFYNVPFFFLVKVITFVTGWQAIILPATTKVFEMHGLQGLRNQFKLYSQINLFFLLPLFVFIMAHAENILGLFFGEVYRLTASNLIVMTLFATFSVFMAANISQPFLYVLNRQNIVLSLRITAGLINILLGLWLIPKVGVMGAVLGTGVSNLITHVAEFILTARLGAAEYPFTFLFKVATCCGLAIGPTIFLPTTGWTNLILSAGLFSLLFGGGALWLRLLSEREINLITEAIPLIGAMRNMIVRGPK